MDGSMTQQADGGPIAAYRAMLARGDLATDPAQALAAERLQALWRRLVGYTPEHAPVERRFWDRLRPGRKKPDDVPENYPHGLYLVGDVGRGKSMLMDLFFDAATAFSSVHAGVPCAHPCLAAGAASAGGPGGR